MKKREFELSDFVDNVISSQKKIGDVLKSSLKEGYSDREILDFFKTVNSESLYYNSSICQKIADYLQLLKDDSNYKKVTLDQIVDIYTSLIRIHPFDIELYESLAWYLDNVFDSPSKARSVLKKGIRLVEKKITKIKKDGKLIQ